MLQCVRGLEEIRESIWVRSWADRMRTRKRTHARWPRDQKNSTEAGAPSQIAMTVQAHLNSQHLGEGLDITQGMEWRDDSIQSGT